MNRTEYLLECLSEECAETSQAVSKALRFGLSAGHPKGNTTNADDVFNEYVHIIAVMDLLYKEGVIQQADMTEAIKAKQASIVEYMKVSRANNTLQD